MLLACREGGGGGEGPHGWGLRQQAWECSRDGALTTAGRRWVRAPGCWPRVQSDCMCCMQLTVDSWEGAPAAWWECRLAREDLLHLHAALSGAAPSQEAYKCMWQAVQAACSPPTSACWPVSCAYAAADAVAASTPVQATVYVYQLVNGEVKVEKIEYSKPSAASAAGVLASAAS